jgi:uncharacterized protein (TIGR03083 family)
MSNVGIERLYGEISGSTATLASIIDGADLATPVPTCPDWTLRKLAAHVGRGQRWAGEIVATRSAAFIPHRAVPDGRLPDDPERRADWLRDGASRLISIIRSAGPDPLWTFTGPRPAAFWARRIAHETAMHRADAEIATGRAPVIDPVIAADGIDEWLWLQEQGISSEDSSLDVLADGQVLHIHATDEGLAGTSEWLVQRSGGRIAVRRGHGKGDAALRGPASTLLLVLLRRLPLDDASVQIVGDRAVPEQWLAATPF